MRRLKLALVAALSTVALIATAGGASADPLGPVCENFPGPRDGKAWWYHAICD